MVSGTQSKKSLAPAPPQASSTRAKKKFTANKRNNIQKRKSATNRVSDNEDATVDRESEAEGQDNTDDPNSSTVPKNQEDTVFRSQFPQLELDTFEEHLDKWTITSLKDSIVKQGSQRSTAHKDIKDLVKIIRMNFEKCILMVALMAGVPEVVIWNLMGFGKNKGKANPWIRFLSFCIKCLGERLPERDNKDAWVDRNQKMADLWNDLSKEEKDVFRDPYFFALAGLPDYSSSDNIDPNDNVEEDTANGVNVQQFDAPALPPAIHQLSDSDKQKYQPLFDRLVNVEKVHLCHGKPEPSPSIATQQKRSLLAVKKAHQDFSVVCQRYQISYYLTSASCGGVNGWSQTFSNNLDFAKWELEANHIPTKFANYVHGKEVAREIEAKRAQPSDERKSQLGSVLNKLMFAQCGEKFPKVRDPVSHIQKKKWNVRIVQKEGSLLSSEALLVGHRKATDVIVKAWTKDIENGNFIIEKILQSEVNQATSTVDAGASNGNENIPNHNGSSALTLKKQHIIDSDNDSENSDRPAPGELAACLKDLACGGSGDGASTNRRKKHQPNATITSNVHNTNPNPTQQHSDSSAENPALDEESDGDFSGV
ncbi:hypothetical protein DFH28DRAFT_1145117 [Melampsora americana]|nr:hypothetical protein DFH28DRAFT_1145117 [Melampsora americana]